MTTRKLYLEVTVFKQLRLWLSDDAHSEQVWDSIPEEDRRRLVLLYTQLAVNAAAEKGSYNQEREDRRDSEP